MTGQHWVLLNSRLSFRRLVGAPCALLLAVAVSAGCGSGGSAADSSTGGNDATAVSAGAAAAPLANSAIAASSPERIPGAADSAQIAAPVAASSAAASAAAAAPAASSPAAAAVVVAPIPTSAPVVATAPIPASAPVVATAPIPAPAVVAAPVPVVAPPVFLEAQLLQVTSRTIREKVSYLSNGLRITGLVCRPNEAGRFPILMYQHAGFSGFGADLGGDGLCQYFSDRGYAVFMSAYRGEDESQGIVEYCAGEVDDSLRMLAIARTQAYVVPDLVALLGFSHGGCISMQMIARGVPAQVVVNVFGPADWSVLHDYASLRVAEGRADADLAKFLAEATATVGTPLGNPAGYRARSPLYSAALLRNYPGAMLVLHGARDEVVPPKQSCDLVRAIGGFRHSHLNFRYVPRLSERTVTSHPNECGGPDMEWADGAHPGKKDWQGERHFVFYDEMSHTSGFQLAYAIDDAENFIRTKLPGGRR